MRRLTGCVVLSTLTAGLLVAPPAQAGRSGLTVLISRSTSGATGNSTSGSPSMTADGRFVVFSSRATNLTSGATDTNGFYDIFQADRDPDVNGRLDDHGGGPAITRLTPLTANGDSLRPRYMAEGFFVVFETDANNLPRTGAGPFSPYRDVVRTSGGGTVEVISADGSLAADGPSYEPSIRPGPTIAFTSEATNLGDGPDLNGAPDVYVKHPSNLITRASVDSSGNELDGASYAPTLSRDGRYIGFVSDAPGLAATNTLACPGFADPTSRPHSRLHEAGRCPDVFLRDDLTGDTVQVSLAFDGGPANGPSYQASLASESNSIIVSSEATNLLPASVLDTNGALSDVFSLAFHGGFGARPGVSLVSASNDGGSGNRESFDAAISANGNVVAFVSVANDLLGPADGPADTDTFADVYVRDVFGASTERASLGPAQQLPNGDSAAPAVSGDGSQIAFSSASSSFAVPDSNGAADVFVRNRAGCASPNNPDGPVSGPVNDNERPGPPDVVRDELYELERQLRDVPRSVEPVLKEPGMLAGAALEAADPSPVLRALAALVRSLPPEADLFLPLRSMIANALEDQADVLQTNYDAATAELLSREEALRESVSPYLPLLANAIADSPDLAVAAAGRPSAVVHDANCTIVAPLEDGRLPELPSAP